MAVKETADLVVKYMSGRLDEEILKKERRYKWRTHPAPQKIKTEIEYNKDKKERKQERKKEKRKKELYIHYVKEKKKD